MFPGIYWHCEAGEAAGLAVCPEADQDIPERDPCPPGLLLLLLLLAPQSLFCSLRCGICSSPSSEAPPGPSLTRTNKPRARERELRDPHRVDHDRRGTSLSPPAGHGAVLRVLQSHVTTPDVYAHV